MKTIKEINFNKKKFIQTILYFKKNIFIILVFLLFYIFYIYTQDIFSNEYILENFIDSKVYSKKCLTLVDNKELPNNIYNFFIKNNVKEKIIPVFFSNITKNLSLETDDKVKKYIFINILTPLIIKYNQEALKDRESLLAINSKLLSEPLNDNDFNTIKLLSFKYNIQMQGENFWDYTFALEALIYNIDIIPTSLLLAVFAKESNWGESNNIVKYNSIISNIEGKSLSINKLFTNQDKYIEKFSSLEESIKFYYHIINTSDKYKNFRKIRHNMRVDNSFNILRLARVFVADFKNKDLVYLEDLLHIFNKNKSLFYEDNVDYNQKYNSTCLNIK